MEIIKSGFRNIFKTRVRSSLTILGVSIGVITLVIISSIGEIGTRAINDELLNMGVESVMVNVRDSSSKSLTTYNAEELEKIDGVREAIPLTCSISRISMARHSTDCMLWGVDNRAEHIISMNVLYGRLVNREDVSKNKKVCVIDEGLALNTYQRSNVVGKTIKIDFGGVYEDFEIIGVVESGMSSLQNLLSSFVPNFAYVPYTTVQTLCGRTSVDRIAVKLDSEADKEVIFSRISKAMDSALCSENSVAVNNLIKEKKQLDNILGIATTALSLIAGISLVVSGFSVMTIMLVSVSERTREIGIKKAIGAKNRSILAEIITESGLITLTGSVFGIAVGIILTFAGCLIFGVQMILNIKLILLSVAVSFVAGALFGAYPAYKASRLSPVEALRSE